MEIFLITAMVVVLGMGLGGFISAMVGSISSRVMCSLLSFAGGVMISVICFKMIPKGIELAGVTMTVIGLVLGATVVAILNSLLLTKVTVKDSTSPESCCAHAGVSHGQKLTSSPALLRSGIIMIVAFSLHKLPEGIAIGAAGFHDIRIGIILAIVAVFHCLPEGMAIGAPLVGSGMSKAKAVGLTALTGVPTIIGGIIGMLIGGLSDIALTLALTGAAGAMFYAVFGELLPHSTHITKSRFTTFAALLGILVGLLMSFSVAGHHHHHPHTHTPHHYHHDHHTH